MSAFSFFFSIFRYIKIAVAPFREHFCCWFTLQ